MNARTARLPAAATVLIALAAAAWQWLSVPPALDDTLLADCLGSRLPMTVARQMPYVAVRVNGSPARFVVDFGADVSAITPTGFEASPPSPSPGTADRYRQFEFFGPWHNVRLLPQPVAPVAGDLRQGGVIGTDFLSHHVYALDYVGGRVYRAGAEAFCGDDVLAEAGFVAIDSRDYYAADTRNLTCPAAARRGSCPNIPSVPLRIGAVAAVAQVDTGFDDSAVRHSVNINAALFDALTAAGIRLLPRPNVALTLTTCQAGVVERVEAWRLPDGIALEFVATSGAVAQRFPDATLFVKRPPPAARVCGGIGTWPQPAAQLGASFFADSALIVDPFRARVWVRPRSSPGLD
ncbi:hypothetical protein [Accumulibacter sp.]|uniref:hypothetical protein n=1 Tax=Accumulibacter sp. TaxID=2053492 RepID=UPI001DBC3CF1|nr:hypothetical protein [Accumulibacter sp.]MCB1893767.1 hypothetical protein [Rhodocyclaceae bacterium]MCP5230204.1 hypothetical protein [Accumulibacter sp.]